MSTADRKCIRACRRKDGACLIPSLHLKTNAAWRARKRKNREYRAKRIGLWEREK